MQSTTQPSARFWSRMFFGAALFNFFFGLPIMLQPKWSYNLAYRPSLGNGEDMALRFWSNFGFAVVLIGGGYYIVSRDITRNRGMVWLGIFAKLFDVVVLTYRFATGVARPVVLLPA